MGNCPLWACVLVAATRMSKRYHPGGDFKETSRAVTESLGREVTLHGQVGTYLRAHATWAMGSPYLFGELVREDAQPRPGQRPVGTRALTGEHLGVSLECLSKVLSRGVPGSDSWFAQAAFLTACRRSWAETGSCWGPSTRAGGWDPGGSLSGAQRRPGQRHTRTESLVRLCPP